MVPYELMLHNFMCYRNGVAPLSLEGLHVACLSGENGAGKSALLDAITWVLWGKARMSDDDLIAQGESEMTVELQFVLNQQHYRVIRRRQRGKTTRSGKVGAGKSALEFHMRDENGWRTLGESTLSDTERQIERVLHMKYDTFINASFLLQGRADEFTSKPPGERKRVLADILDLEAYDQLEKRARQQASGLKDRIHGLNGAIELLQQEADKQEYYAQQVTEAQQRVDDLQGQLEQATKAQRSADDEVRRLEDQQQQLDTVRKDVTSLQQQQAERQQEMERIQQEIDADEEVLRRQDEILAGVEQLSAAQQHQHHLDELFPRYEKLKKQHSELQEQFREEKGKLQSKLDQQQQTVERLREQANRRPEVQHEMTNLQRQLDALAPLEAEHQQASTRRNTLDAHISQVHDLRFEHQQRTSTIAQRREALQAEQHRQQQELARLQKQQAAVDGWQADLQAAQEQHHALPALTAQLGDLRQQHQHMTAESGRLRAECQRFKQQAEDLKERKKMLHDEGASSCPLCGSDLGAHGVESIVSHYEQDITDLRQRYRESKDQAEQLDRDLVALAGQIQAAEEHEQQAREGAARVASLQQQLNQARQWQDEQQQAQATLATIERQLAQDDYEPEARADLRDVERKLTALASSSDYPLISQNGDWSALGRHLEQQRQQLVAHQQRLEQQLAGRADLATQLATQQRELADLQQAAADLPTAEASAASLADTIQRADFAHEIRRQGEAVRAELDALGYTPEAYQQARQSVKALAHWNEEQQRLDLAANRLDRNRRALQRESELLQRYTGDLQVRQQEHDQLVEALRVLPKARRHAHECQQAAAEHQRSLKVASDTLSENQHHLKQAQDKAADLTRKQQQRDELGAQQSVMQDLAAACGKKGVQAMLIETAIPEIEREANRLLGRITDNQMHLTFEMQRNTKKGDLTETLDIKIADGLGTRSYQAFSGGEATRINFAIRIALSRLLARRAGASLETLVIDEGMSALDAEGRERFVEAISSVQQDFQRILVITHLDELKDRFPARIEITKTSTGSVWEFR